jgi:hypothetical protein
MSNYIYSIKVNEALERYGARTHGSLERRIERLKRFTDITNMQYAEQLRVQNEEFLALMDKRYNNGLDLLCRAIENGHVKTKRG